MQTGKGRPPQSRPAGRSNLYSADRLTNWSRYDPFEAETSGRSPHLQPACVVPTGPADECPIFEMPLHPSFIRPFTAEDVRDALVRIPQHFLRGLRGVYLLGGTPKQERASRGDLFHYGCYGWGRVHLHAFPRALLESRYKRPPRPHAMQAYRRAGAVWEEVADGWVCRFDRESLKAFYLTDVLVHEIGHHADRSNRHKNDAQAERFAEWFARTYGTRACRGSGRQDWRQI